ncbi:hypothetical protein N7523_008606 [Penicillium sp. IBT 18751x]|nr:hypothetical protein N7523_008606 [Penicillium sp. IBT 18751x]
MAPRCVSCGNDGGKTPPLADRRINDGVALVKWATAGASKELSPVISNGDCGSVPRDLTLAESGERRQCVKPLLAGAGGGGVAVAGLFN